MDTHFFARGLVCLGGTPGTGATGATGLADPEVAVVRETIEVVTSDIRMYVEEPGDLGGGHRLGRFAYRDIDGATGRIAQGGGEIRDPAVEGAYVHLRYLPAKTIVSRVF
jgi:hypothetical protein